MPRAGPGFSDEDFANSCADAGGRVLYFGGGRLGEGFFPSCFPPNQHFFSPLEMDLANCCL